jgi:hypothetical protein
MALARSGKSASSWTWLPVRPAGGRRPSPTAAPSTPSFPVARELHGTTYDKTTVLMGQASSERKNDGVRHLVFTGDTAVLVDRAMRKPVPIGNGSCRWWC